MQQKIRYILFSYHTSIIQKKARLYNKIHIKVLPYLFQPITPAYANSVAVLICSLPILLYSDFKGCILVIQNIRKNHHTQQLFSLITQYLQPHTHPLFLRSAFPPEALLYCSHKMSGWIYNFQRIDWSQDKTLPPYPTHPPLSVHVPAEYSLTPFLSTLRRFVFFSYPRHKADMQHPSDDDCHTISRFPPCLFLLENRSASCFLIFSKSAKRAILYS